MLEVKILINLQAGCGEHECSAHPSVLTAGGVSSCLETIEVIDPCFQSVRSVANRDWGICSIRIDFQLGTNGGDASGVIRTRQALNRNLLKKVGRRGE